MKHVETFLILQFEVCIIACNQHVDDVVVSSPYRIMKRRVSWCVLYNRTTIEHFYNAVSKKRNRERNRNIFITKSAEFVAVSASDDYDGKIH